MFENLRFRTKIALVTIAMSVVAISGAAFLTYNQLATDATYRLFINRDDREAVTLTRTADKINALLYAAHRMTDQNDPAVLAEIAKRFRSDEAGARSLFAEATQIDARMGEVISPLAKRYDQLQKMMEQVVVLAEQNDSTKARQLLLQMDNFGIALAIDIGSLAGQHIEQVKTSSSMLAASAATSIKTCVGIILILVGAVLAVSLMMSKRSIVAPLLLVRDHMLAVADGRLEDAVQCLDRSDEVGDMAKALHKIQSSLQHAKSLEEIQAKEQEKVAYERKVIAEKAAREADEERIAVEAIRQGLAAAAEGNLAYRIEAKFPERLQVMRSDFNTSFQKLQQAMAAVQQGVVAIGAGTNEISTVSTDMSRRTEQQAASIEESSVALGRVVDMLRDSAESAGKAAAVTDEAREGAEKSGAIVHAAVEAMNHIETSFSQISQVIGLIDDIAFQTNLLALNAGIEAARAGDAGRGFAVVATEVRTLAQRSAEGARQVKDLVSSSGAFVTDGVRLVRNAGSALEVILGQVGEINKLVGAIAQASAGQSTAVEEINLAVEEMTKTTQQNAAMVEQSTAAIASLDQEAEVLRSKVAVFKLGQDKNTGFHINNGTDSPDSEYIENNMKKTTKKKESILDPENVDDKNSGWKDFI